MSKQHRKRKAPAASTSRDQKKKSSSSVGVSSKASKPGPSKLSIGSLFGDEDRDLIAEAKSRGLPSVLWRRVPGGLIKRCEDLDGGLFVELRVYNKADIVNVEPRHRYWKAAVNLRYLVDEGEPDVDLLYKFIKVAKAKFTGEGTFTAEKKED